MIVEAPDFSMAVEIIWHGKADPMHGNAYFFIESMKGNGALQRARRDDAYAEFQQLLATMSVQLTSLLALVRK
jgi:hypothetical protein